MPHILGAEKGGAEGFPAQHQGSHKKGCGMTSDLHLDTATNASATAANDGLIKCCCLLRAGHIFRNCAVFKPLPQNTARLEAHLQPFFLLQPEKGEPDCKTCMFHFSRTVSWCLTYAEILLQGLKSITPQRKTQEQREGISGSGRSCLLMKA